MQTFQDFFHFLADINIPLGYFIVINRFNYSLQGSLISLDQRTQIDHQFHPGPAVCLFFPIVNALDTAALPVLQPPGGLLKLFVGQQLLYQFLAGIRQFLVSFSLNHAGREQQLGLNIKQIGCHQQEIAQTLQIKTAAGLQILQVLITDNRNRYIINIHLIFFHQIE